MQLISAGNIPADLSRLSSLQILNVYNNNLSGKSNTTRRNSNIINAGYIPAGLSELRYLCGLFFNKNNISGNALCAISI